MGRLAVGCVSDSITHRKSVNNHKYDALHSVNVPYKIGDRTKNPVKPFELPPMRLKLDFQP